jgi:iron(III) transport system permease protein
VILLTIALLGFYVIRKYSSLRSYAAGTKGGQWNPRTRRLRGRTTLLLYLIVIPTLFLALIPQISVILLSLTQSRQTTAVIPEITLENYISMAETYPDVITSINLTLIYGLIATVVIVLLGASAAYLIARKDIPGKTLLDMLVTAPIALPGIVIATGYFTLFYQTPFFPPSTPAFLIIMSYTVRKFPFTVRAAFAGLQSTPIDLEEASQNMGADKNKTFVKITLPLIGVSVLAGSLLSFVYSVSEVSTSLILGSVGPDQAPMTYWTAQLAASQNGVGYAACLGVLMMILQMAVITITNKILGTRSSAITGI